jgi:hypothetical protein
MNRTVRFFLALALPAAILLFFVLLTITLSRGHRTGLCDTWLASVLPYCT